ncbi:MAG TPA: O-antigen ligase family protein [Oculatellaceae cyanobacterium]|jgi:putative inorganic carbon (HCO3(-)) transporter
MSLLRPSLESSLLFKPWVSLAQLPGATIGQWLEKSFIGRFLFSSPNQQRQIPILFQRVFPLGIAILFILLSFASTGVIGAATWFLFALAVLAGLLARPAVPKHLTIIDLFIALFLASAALSTAFSSFFATSLIGLGKMLTFVAGYVVFRVLSEFGHKPVIVLMGLLTAIGLGEALIGFYQHINHIQPLATWSDPSINPELQMTRIFGTLQPYNPNLLAGFLTPCFAATVGNALLLFRKKTWPLAVVMLLISVLILIAMVWTGSRGGFLAIGAMLLMVFAYVGHLLWHDNQLKPFKTLKTLWISILIVSLLGLGFGLGTSEKIRARVASIFAMREDSSISYRLNVYQSATQMVRDNPVVGIGPGNSTFKLVYGLYMVPGYNALGAYSVPLEIAVEQGWLGLIIFLSMLLVLKLRVWLALDDTQRPLTEKLLIGALFTGVVGSFVYGFFDTIWYRPAVNLLFWFMVASLARFSEPKVNIQDAS